MVKKIPTGLDAIMAKEKDGVKKAIKLLTESLEMENGAFDAFASDVALKLNVQLTVYRIYKLQKLLTGKINNAEIARKIGVAEKTLRYWRDCDQTPSMDRFLKLNKVYENYKKQVNNG